MLSAEELRGLEAHKYSCNGRSIIEPVFQVFWTWLVEFMPRWLAPNLITFTGLVCNIVGSLVLFWHCPTLTEAAPSWSYFLAAVSLFIYQSLDAVDGKQARRTQSASPLGELFDHGCDALSGGLLILSTQCVLRNGNDLPLVFSSLLLQLSVFYSAHWRAYTSGTLQFGRIDVTEAQVCMMLVSVCSGLVGPDFWLFTIYGWPIGYIFLYSVNCFTVVVLLNNFWCAFLERNSGHCQPDAWFSPMVSFSTLILTTLGVLWASPSQIGLQQPLLFGLLFSVIFAHVASRLVVAHMSKTPMALYDFSVFPMQAILLNALLNAPLSEHYAIATGLLFATVNLFYMAGQTCREIAAHMGIYVFTIGKRID